MQYLTIATLKNGLSLNFTLWNIESAAIIENIISEAIKSGQYQEGNTEERVGILVTLMEELVTKGIIKDYKVDLSNGKSEPNILFYYNFGGYGVVIVNGFSGNQN